MKAMKKLLVLMLGVAFLTCTVNCKNEERMKVRDPYTQKYTNADFYKDGELDPEIALKAYLDMLEYYGVPYSDFLKENLWITDFNLGDFENVVAACPVPIVIAGGKKLPEKEALELCYMAINDGAAGVDMGRNVFQSEDPVAMIQAVSSVVHKNYTVDQAYELFEELKQG